MVLPPKKVDRTLAATQPVIDYSDLGRPVNLNEPLEVKGVNPLWVRDTQLLVSINTTKWDEFEEEGKTVREGRAILNFSAGDKRRVVTIAEGDEKVVFGYRVSVTYAFEFYDKRDATFIPHVKMTISR